MQSLQDSLVIALVPRRIEHEDRAPAERVVGIAYDELIRGGDRTLPPQDDLRKSRLVVGERMPVQEPHGGRFLPSAREDGNFVVVTYLPRCGRSGSQNRVKHPSGLVGSVPYDSFAARDIRIA